VGIFIYILEILRDAPGGGVPGGCCDLVRSDPASSSDKTHQSKQKA